jgi:hypothetical protein
MEIFNQGGSEMKVCPICGTKLSGSASFCASCGSSVENAETEDFREAYKNMKNYQQAMVQQYQAQAAQRYQAPPVQQPRPVQQYQAPPVQQPRPAQQYQAPPVQQPRPVQQYQVPPVQQPGPVQQFQAQPQMQPQVQPQMQPQVQPQMQPQVQPQMQPQMQPQVPPQMQPQMPPQQFGQGPAPYGYQPPYGYPQPNRTVALKALDVAIIVSLFLFWLVALLFYGIPLLWQIPLTILTIIKITRGEYIAIWYKLLILFLVSFPAGIFLLFRPEFKPIYPPYPYQR